MEIDINDIQHKLSEKGLKITLQRISVLEAIYTMKNHPTAEQIIDRIRVKYPHIATGSVYRILDTLVKKGLINRVLTKDDVMRYDGVIANHHHLTNMENEEIHDYMNEELDELLKKYFEKNAIEGYRIDSIKLHITGKPIKRP